MYLVVDQLNYLWQWAKMKNIVFKFYVYMLYKKKKSFPISVCHIQTFCCKILCVAFLFFITLTCWLLTSVFIHCQEVCRLTFSDLVTQLVFCRVRKCAFVSLR